MWNAVRACASSALFALVLLGVAAAPASAQGIGIKGGWLFPGFTSDAIEFDNRTGYQVGLFFGGNRDGAAGVMAEVNYGKKGAEYLGDDLDVTFVSVPVMLRVNGGSGNIAAYGAVGPQLDWLINRSFGEDDFLDFEESTESFEFGLTVGGGIELSRFIVELRYVHGLRSIAKDFNLLETKDLKTKTFAILFGVRFH